MKLLLATTAVFLLVGFISGQYDEGYDDDDAQVGAELDADNDKEGNVGREVNGQVNEKNQQESSTSSSFFSLVEKLIPSPVAKLGMWLFSPVEWTTHYNSDKHDLYLTDTVLSQYNSPSESKTDLALSQSPTVWNSISSFFSFLKGGRKVFDQMNFISLAYDTFLQVGQCMTTDDFVDPDLGAFSLNKTRDCSIKCGRMIPGVLCCNPQTPEMLDVKFRLKAPWIRGEKILNWRDPQHRDFLGNTSRVVFISHGWLEKIATSEWMTAVRDAYVQQGHAAIIIDWRRGNGIQYWQAMANVRIVAAMMGKAVLNWGIHDRTLMIGFSLGAQMIAEAGLYTQTHGGVKIDECHGLDPAGPFYDGCDADIRLDKSDCRLVQVIHTSSESIPALGALVMSYGTYYKSGHCDFWINCGSNQGPCVDLDFMDLMKAAARIAVMSDGEMQDWLFKRAMCSHWRAPLVYLSALRHECDFQAVPCPDCGNKRNCVSTLQGSSNNTLLPFSSCSPDNDDNYYVKSGPYEPFCDTKWGTEDRPLTELENDRTAKRRERFIV